MHNIQTIQSLKLKASVNSQATTLLRQLNEQGEILGLVLLSPSSNSSPALEQAGYRSESELIDQTRQNLHSIQTILGYVAQKTIDEMKAQLDRFQNHSMRIESKRSTMLVSEYLLWSKNCNHLTQLLTNHTEETTHELTTQQQICLLISIIALLYSQLIVLVNSKSRQNLSKRVLSRMQTLHEQIRTDPLTGLLNRRGWSFYSQQELRNPKRLPLGVAILDIDHFKSFNDTHGHDAGDQRLIKFAQLLKLHFRPCDRVARIGGEEFAILLPNCTTEQARRIVDRVRQQTQPIQFSAGISNMEMAETIEQALAQADAALYLAKRSGRNQTQIAQPHQVKPLKKAG